MENWNWSLGHEIRKATSVEIAAIKDVLGAFMPSKSWTPWQGGRKITKSDGSWSNARLPAKQWRYFVITFEGSINVRQPSVDRRTKAAR